MVDAIIIGGDHHNTLGVLRSLGGRGVRCNLVIVPSSGHSYVSKSKYAKSAALLNDLKELIPYLINYQSATKPVVFCCSDPVASVIDSNYDVLKDKFHIPFSSCGAGYLSFIMNKKNMAKIALECGLPTPISWYSVKDAKFPCFIKPLISKEGSKSDICICRSARELYLHVQSPHIASNFQIQQYIEKDFEFQLIGCSLDGGNQVFIPGISYIIRSSETSNTGYLKYISKDLFQFNYYSQTIDFIRRIGFSGLFSVEFIRDKSGNDYFMEINLRNDGNAICATAAGANLHYLWYKFNAENFIPQDCTILKREVFVQPDFDDMFLAKRGEITWIEWIKTWCSADCHMEFDKRDIVPFFWRIFQFITHKY